uniref:Cadherin domain-containing protein n=1 Tax=Knipowitschia caucasica TaxID=637954 RepID=A0AAV2L456_KNICA
MEMVAKRIILFPLHYRVLGWIPRVCFFHLRVPESSTVGSAVGRIKAHDLDIGRNAEVEYTIVPGDGGAIFDITTNEHNQEGIIILKKIPSRSPGPQPRSAAPVRSPGPQPRSAAPVRSPGPQPRSAAVQSDAPYETQNPHQRAPFSVVSGVRAPCGQMLFTALFLLLKV